MLTSTGQNEARTRWGTHESGAAFERKKLPYLSQEAQEFIAQQTTCILGGPGGQNRLSGLIVLGLPGFIQTPSQQICLLPIERGLFQAPLVEHISQAQRHGNLSHIALCLLCHATRQRLCIQGRAEFINSSHTQKSTCLCLYVEQAFFHCPKYIRTHVPGLTVSASGGGWQMEPLLRENLLSQEVAAFLAQQRLCYLCTMNRSGQCGINHRGGKPGFLLSLPPDMKAPRGRILLPDYAGNGAFEAIGNILETGLAALIIPSYADQLALIISGTAQVAEPQELAPDLQARCPGALRVLLLDVESVEGQGGDWRIPLSYEQNRASLLHEGERGS